MSPLLSILLLAAFSGGGEPAEAPLLVLKAAKVFTADEELGVIDNGAVVVAGERIRWVGRAAELEVPEGAEVLDLGRRWLVPGLIEPHCHIAGSLSDLNDGVYLTNPDLNSHCTVEPGRKEIGDAVAGGVTSALLIPGSAVNMTGFGMLVKMGGRDVEEMVVRSPGSLKVAQAGNPERWGFGPGRTMMNFNTRTTLQRGLAWAEAWERGETAFDPFWDDFSALRDGRVPVSVHTQMYQVVLTTLTMLKRDLGLDAFVDHGTFDGYKTAHLAAELGVPVMNGPRQYWFDRTTGRIQGCTAGWAEAVEEGLILGYNTDAPVVPEEDLVYQAAMGVRLGHDDPEGALEGVTAHAARALNYDDRAGRILPGLDADLVCWEGYPLDRRSHVLKAWIRGRKVYDAEEERQRY